jgi:hypothetical protein
MLYVLSVYVLKGEGSKLYYREKSNYFTTSIFFLLLLFSDFPKETKLSALNITTFAQPFRYIIHHTFLSLSYMPTRQHETVLTNNLMCSHA